MNTGTGTGETRAMCAYARETCIVGGWRVVERNWGAADPEVRDWYRRHPCPPARPGDPCTACGSSPVTNGAANDE